MKNLSRAPLLATGANGSLCALSVYCPVKGDLSIEGER